ncbi:spermatogenesis-associated protein 24-like [Styela clava]
MDELSDHTLKFSGNINTTLSSSFSSSIGKTELTDSSTASCSSTHDLVRATLQDVIGLQHNAIEQMLETKERHKLNYVMKTTYDEAIKQFEDEQLEHRKTKLLLEKEQEKLRFALGEIEILTKHLEREKSDHENLIKSVKQKANRETQRSDLLYDKCTKNEEIIQRQKDDITLKENEISNLKQRLKSQSASHKQFIHDMEIQKVQEEYMARSLSEKDKRKRRGVP